MKSSVKDLFRVHPAFLILALIFCICLMASGFADAKVGDYLNFKMTISDPVNGTTVTQIENEILTYNSVEKNYGTKETQTALLPVAKPPVVTLSTVDADELLSFKDVAQMLKECTKMGGIRVKVEVDAGTFSACKLDGDSDSIYYAQVPQGLIKSVLIDKETGFKSVLELQSFRFGK
jgi:hypothetical protein